MISEILNQRGRGVREGHKVALIYVVTWQEVLSYPGGSLLLVWRAQRSDRIRISRPGGTGLPHILAICYLVDYKKWKYSLHLLLSRRHSVNLFSDVCLCFCLIWCDLSSYRTLAKCKQDSDRRWSSVDDCLATQWMLCNVVWSMWGRRVRWEYDVTTGEELIHGRGVSTKPGAFFFYKPT